MHKHGGCNQQKNQENNAFHAASIHGGSTVQDANFSSSGWTQYIAVSTSQRRRFPFDVGNERRVLKRLEVDLYVGQCAGNGGLGKSCPDCQVRRHFGVG